jgi:DNA-binding LytR/AlgR family response regulator
MRFLPRPALFGSLSSNFGAPARHHTVPRRAQRHDKVIKVVCGCGDRIAAIDAIQSIQPDLLFLDIHMRGFTGHEVLTRLDDVRPPMKIHAASH